MSKMAKMAMNSFHVLGDYRSSGTKCDIINITSIEATSDDYANDIIICKSVRQFV